MDTTAPGAARSETQPTAPGTASVAGTDAAPKRRSRRSTPHYTPRVGEALAFAADAHASQSRKRGDGPPEPYLSHILIVAGMVAHYGGDEDQIIAGALHDAVEDQGGEVMAREIGERFGPRVEAIVRDCSDSVAPAGQTKAPWRDRKEEFLASLDTPDVHGSRLVEACDKLANLRDIVEDVRADGLGSFDRFRGGREGTLWYYRELGVRLLPQVPAVAPAYSVELAELNRLVGLLGA
jgi:(p)ppGpp synthase/HD superfamily hydrolase